jgi:hypothetical protein
MDLRAYALMQQVRSYERLKGVCPWWDAIDA